MKTTMITTTRSTETTPTPVKRNRPGFVSRGFSAGVAAAIFATSTILPALTPTASASATATVLEFEQDARAERVLLEQTPLRNQGTRTTCITFAALAALEAAYKRAGYGDLDLAEQFANHMGKTFWLHAVWADHEAAGPSAHESQVGAFGGGGGAGWVEQLSKGMAVCEEEHMPYSPVEDRVGTAGIAWNNPFWRVQFNAGNYNLHPRHLPREALTAPRYYSVKSYRSMAIPSDYNVLVRNIRNVLRQDREVVIDFLVKGDRRGSIWQYQEPSDDGGGHAMVIIGYDTTDPDPANHYFICKNSWGATGNPGGYTHISFEYTRFIYAAAYITEVAEPKQWPQLPWIGRYFVRIEGRDGVLDIYHLPGMAQWHFDNERLGITDRRIGTFFENGDPDRAYRVNGELDGLRATMHINFDKPLTRWDDLSGTRIEARLSRNHEVITGGVNGYRWRGDYIRPIRNSEVIRGGVVTLDGGFHPEREKRQVRLTQGGTIIPLETYHWSLTRIVAWIPDDLPNGEYRLAIASTEDGSVTSNLHTVRVVDATGYTAPRPLGELITLNRWWDEINTDNYCTTQLADSSMDFHLHVREEGKVYSPNHDQPAGTVPLYRWWNRTTKDTFLTTDPEWAGTPGSFKDGYRFMAVEGYILPPTAPVNAGTPLYAWHSAARNDRFATTDPAWRGEPGQTRSGYRFVRLEGYLPLVLREGIALEQPLRINPQVVTPNLQLQSQGGPTTEPIRENIEQKADPKKNETETKGTDAEETDAEGDAEFEPTHRLREVTPYHRTQPAADAAKPDGELRARLAVRLIERHESWRLIETRRGLRVWVDRRAIERIESDQQ